MEQFEQRSDLSPTEVYRLFATAENAIKDIELTSGELNIPAINQLRYSAYHLANYLKDTKNKDELDCAVKHCKRATFDAYEAGILYYLSEFNAFQKDYKFIVITDVIKNYKEYCKKCNEIRDFIKDKSAEESRAKHYADCQGEYKKLVEVVDELNNSRSELNKIIKREQKEALFAYSLLFIFLISVSVAIL